MFEVFEATLEVGSDSEEHWSVVADGLRHRFPGMTSHGGGSQKFYRRTNTRFDDVGLHGASEVPIGNYLVPYNLGDGAFSSGWSGTITVPEPGKVAFTPIEEVLAWVRLQHSIRVPYLAGSPTIDVSVANFSNSERLEGDTADTWGSRPALIRIPANTAMEILGSWNVDAVSPAGNTFDTEFLYLSLFGSIEGGVQGTVTVGGTSDPIEGARVRATDRLFGHTSETLTATDGTYFLSMGTGFHQDIEVTHPGSTQTATDDINLSLGTWTRHYQLDEPVPVPTVMVNVRGSMSFQHAYGTGSQDSF